MFCDGVQVTNINETRENELLFGSKVIAKQRRIRASTKLRAEA